MIINTYLTPNKTFRELRDMVNGGTMDPLRDFSEACREENSEIGLLALIRHYFYAAQAMSPVALGNGTLPRGPLHIPEGDDSRDPCLPPNCTLRCPRLPVSPPSLITRTAQVLSDWS